MQVDSLLDYIEVGSKLATVFNALTNLLIVAAVVAMIAFTVQLILRGRSDLEVAIRSIAAATGFLIYVGSQAVGLSIPSFMLSAIGTANPFTVGFLGVVLPGLAGAIVAWFCLQSIQQTEELGVRMVVLLSTFIVALFGDAYVATLGNDAVTQQGIDLALLPNLTFVVGLSLYVVFRYLPQTD